MPMKKIMFLNLFLFFIALGCQLPNTLLQKAIDQPDSIPTTCNDLQTLLLTKDNLLGGGSYTLSGPDYLRQLDNEDILEAWGSERGQNYLEKSGRITGCMVTYQRSNDAASLPEWIRHNLVLFENAEGARITIEEYPRTLLNPDYTRLDQKVDIGDTSYAYVRLPGTESEEAYTYYEIQTAYQNYVSIVTLWGNQEDVSYGYVEILARMVLAKIQNQPSENAALVR